GRALHLHLAVTVVRGRDAAVAGRERRVAAELAARGHVRQHRLRGVFLPRVRDVHRGLVAALVRGRVRERLALVAAGPGHQAGRPGRGGVLVAVVGGGHGRVAGGQRLRIAAQVLAGGNTRQQRREFVLERDVLHAAQRARRPRAIDVQTGAAT